MRAFGFGELDVGLCQPTDLGPGLSARPILRERLLLALPSAHPLAQCSMVHVTALHGQPFIAYGPDSPYMHALMRGWLAQHGVAPDVIQSLAHAEAILSLVAVGLGLALVPDHARFLPRAGLVYRPIDGESAEAVTHLVKRADSTNALVRLVGHVVETVACNVTGGG